MFEAVLVTPRVWPSVAAVAFTSDRSGTLTTDAPTVTDLCVTSVTHARNDVQEATRRAQESVARAHAEAHTLESGARDQQLTPSSPSLLAASSHDGSGSHFYGKLAANEQLLQSCEYACTACLSPLCGQVQEFHTAVK